MNCLSTDENGKLTNHSGCGNDINSNSGASKKIIIDSLKSLIQNYSVDGFRFDLGELLGIDLLQEIEDELVKEFPNIILIAEHGALEVDYLKELIGPNTVYGVIYAREVIQVYLWQWK